MSIKGAGAEDTVGGICGAAVVGGSGLAVRGRGAASENRWRFAGLAGIESCTGRLGAAALGVGGWAIRGAGILRERVGASLTSLRAALAEGAADTVGRASSAISGGAGGVMVGAAISAAIELLGKRIAGLMPERASVTIPTTAHPTSAKTQVGRPFSGAGFE
jgi:hypothetical protein